MTQNTNNSVDFEFIAEKIDKQDEIEMFLVNGVKLGGVIYKQDDISLVMSGKKGKSQLVFKKNISTIT